MLSFSPIEKPKIDIELYGTDINIAPIDKVHIMDEDSFEHFTLEWLYGCKKDKKEKCERKRIQCISELCRSDSIVKIHAKTCTLCTRINSLRFADSLFERN